ncbi:MAG TPA: hypothetical protein VFY73_00480 [Ideonella sp.]|uniref:hypothetical protein n=1 Tax=Ideonella sp. TaxID=1929293 RepID=UPI002E30FD5C|nr:hypothetical protein [Ideonella sp.]HEX5682479.1 hypothetical protein [Ideonella sp.]
MNEGGTARRALLLVGLSIAAGTQAASPPPPAVNFSLQWRLTPWPSPPVPTVTPGSVTVSTNGPATTTAGSQTTRTSTPEPSAPRLIVRNGGQAQIALRRDDTSAPPDWIWTALGQGLDSRTHRHARRDVLWVQVQWPGGSAQAQLSFRFEQPVSDIVDGTRGDAAQQLDGDLLLPLDQWQEVGHWTAPDGTGQALQLRLNRLP